MSAAAVPAYLDRPGAVGVLCAARVAARQVVCRQTRMGGSRGLQLPGRTMVLDVPAVLRIVSSRR